MVQTLLIRNYLGGFGYSSKGAEITYKARDSEGRCMGLGDSNTRDSEGRCMGVSDFKASDSEGR